MNLKGCEVPSVKHNIYIWQSNHSFEQKRGRKNETAVPSQVSDINAVYIQRKMLKVKGLQPAHREKKRYIVYEVSSSKDMIKTQQELVNELQQLLGVFMSAQAGIVPVTVNKKTQRGILRVNHTAVDYIKSCFVLLQNINNEPTQLHSVNVSGVLGKAKASMDA